MRALLSVYDKTGLVEFARTLDGLGYELLSTGGSAAALVDAGLKVTPVEEVTGFPEILDGRVKTLHPGIHAGLLARMDLPEHVATLQEHSIAPIDLLVSNLYPFERAVQDSDLDTAQRVEQIDIGGPAMVRAAAKNFASVVVVTDPEDYDRLAGLLVSSGVDLAGRRALAAKAFGHVSTYDSLVAAFLRGAEPLFPDELTLPLRHAATPRYGENPQQRAAAYSHLNVHESRRLGILDAVRLSGEPLSFNNYLDGDAAWQAAQQFEAPAAVIVKHMVPCGMAVRSTLSEAYDAAFDGDRVSAYGGVVALNRTVDAMTASSLRKIKLDIIVAPSYEPDALDILLKKKGTRLLTLPNRVTAANVDGDELDVRPIAGGMLVQTADSQIDDVRSWTVATDLVPTKNQMRDLEFAWKASRLVKSNAIVFAMDAAIVGVGAGQPNRLESVLIASRKAGDKAKGAALASDAFFPFADGVEQAIRDGITSIVQPGGSVRDDEVIAAANRARITMVFTRTRHFRH
ncbi:MAG: bifunctional phosphoribosylaminoimidazolecarboxamide formyltransferase/IMP cyclohydrolase [Chloroflexia bacterium]|nr:bifunctional phosphoribosylaminoimidazolecarboxamide formyltransferase/IMP cyclohydrolase [Chloroflexia bacterium]